MEIKWSRLAIKQLFDIIQYLEENDSVDYAEKLEKKVLSKIKSLPQKIEIYQLDRLKQANDGNFYAFEIDSYRISYRQLQKEIRILRIRHSSRRPFTR
ncbi:type II toxin-antitoxin system RelE/ParE family toxin [Pedobacter frigiditerrae]|uniref:type II toxin-antitoxin system RelE/ParE family toxin n=1 Tax=Pedobacter frigiditerrae TaxID=2530452 RepID=UPI00292ED8AB|nr:type II toxin-antitoxin system RelE/ParE family toxin [Pedobacter frigiditerrae]